MAFKFSPLTVDALKGYGLNDAQVEYVASVEGAARSLMRVMRVPSEATVLRRRAKQLDRQSRRRRVPT